MIDGLVVVDKPPGCTSHDVVAACRRRFSQRRVGHGGTLDPAATGVLLVGLGQVTRLLRFVSALPKSYTAEVVLGRATTTLDAGGETVATFDMSSVTADDVRAAAAQFVGDIDQLPPMVSAVKVGGRRLHELAREGTEVERERRRVTVYRFDVLPSDDPSVYRLEVVCSAGTYVRALADDLGRALGGGAHLRELRRTEVGSFTVDEAVPLDSLSPADVLPPIEALREHPRVVVEGDVAVAVAHGAVLDRSVITSDVDGPWAIVGSNGHFIAVYQDYTGGRVKPAVVLTTEPS